MNIPNKVRIGSMDYEVVKGEEAILLDGRQCHGMIDFIYHKIELDTTSQDSQGMEVTFLHELVHGILMSRGMEEESHDEKLVDELAKGLHQVIRDNHSIFCNKETAELKLRGETISERLNDYVAKTFDKKDTK